MNTTPGSMGDEFGTETTGSGASRMGTQRMKEQLRSAGSAATDTVRGQARHAQDWARTQMTDLQARVQSDPYRATMWALGLGVAAGLLLASMMRGGRS